MLVNTEKKSLLKAVATVAVVALLATTSSPAFSAGNCLFTAQLASDPAVRAEFTSKMRSINAGMIADESDELIYETDIPAGEATRTFNNEPGSGIDRLSQDCLTCHDGVMAQNFNVRIKNNPAGRVMSLEDIVGGHPVGMEYDRYVSVDSKGYRNDVKFSREMVFADGKVGCLTCHNPLNRDKGHLVMKNEKSELCFACHNK